MDMEELQVWKEGVEEFLHHLAILKNDKEIIVKTMEQHLSQYFTWDKIEFAPDFSKITLHYEKEVGAVIDPDRHIGLGIPWIVSPHYDDKAFKIIRIELYPFGLPKEGELIVED